MFQRVLIDATKNVHSKIKSKFLIPNIYIFDLNRKSKFKQLHGFCGIDTIHTCQMHPNHPHVKCLELSVATTRRRQRVFRCPSHGSFQKQCYEQFVRGLDNAKKFATQQHVQCAMNLLSTILEFQFAVKSSCDSTIILDTGIDRF